MSGTSLDGIDVAIVDICGSSWRKRVQLRAFYNEAYPRAIRDALLRVSNAATHTAEIARLHFLLGRLYATAVKRACRRGGVRLETVELIASHGQTIFHEGDPVSFLGHRVASTLQIGDGSVIAELTGKPVVSDFRPRDIAAGGRGAPLVPYADYLLFRHRQHNRVVLNIGGIANLTAVPAKARPEEVIGFDTGPGNMVIDALVDIYSGGKLKFDRDGRMAAKGKVIRPLLNQLLADPYYRRRPPKTAGREQYGREFVSKLVATGYALPDLIATATVLSAATIAKSIRRFVVPVMRVDQVIVSGGGAHNPRIIEHLVALLTDMNVCTSEQYGVSVDAKEALAFALLGYETWRRRPSNLPSVTGAARPVVLGKVSY
jgi:anhydro-N-acetylmuramic acid kinase